MKILGRGDALLMPQVTKRVLSKFASDQPVRAAKPNVRVDALTEREHDTLLLVARGLSNAEIAKELYVSPETVKTHVSNILMKLGLRDRIGAVIWAYEHGVIAPSGI